MNIAKSIKDTVDEYVEVGCCFPVFNASIMDGNEMFVAFSCQMSDRFLVTTFIFQLRYPVQFAIADHRSSSRRWV